MEGNETENSAEITDEVTGEAEETAAETAAGAETEAETEDVGAPISSEQLLLLGVSLSVLLCGCMTAFFYKRR